MSLLWCLSGLFFCHEPKHAVCQPVSPAPAGSRALALLIAVGRRDGSRWGRMFVSHTGVCAHN